MGVVIQEKDRAVNSLAGYSKGLAVFLLILWLQPGDHEGSTSTPMGAVTVDAEAEGLLYYLTGPDIATMFHRALKLPAGGMHLPD
jgi:hypothetical protein